jgi:hypothetical protein
MKPGVSSLLALDKSDSIALTLPSVSRPLAVIVWSVYRQGGQPHRQCQQPPHCQLRQEDRQPHWTTSVVDERASLVDKRTSLINEVAGLLDEAGSEEVKLLTPGFIDTTGKLIKQAGPLIDQASGLLTEGNVPR